LQCTIYIVEKPLLRESITPNKFTPEGSMPLREISRT